MNKGLVAIIILLFLVVTGLVVYIVVTQNVDEINDEGMRRDYFPAQERVQISEQQNNEMPTTCTRGRTMNPPKDLPPVITSLSSVTGPIGTILEIRGCNLSGFEGDLGITFERSDGKQIGLVDTFGSYPTTEDTLIKVIVKEPCAQGETIYGAYSGLPSVCDYTPLTPGSYKLYSTAWGMKSNEVIFTVTPQ